MDSPKLRMPNRRHWHTVRRVRWVIGVSVNVVLIGAVLWLSYKKEKAITSEIVRFKHPNDVPLAMYNEEGPAWSASELTKISSAIALIEHTLGHDAPVARLLTSERELIRPAKYWIHFGPTLSAPMYTSVQTGRIMVVRAFVDKPMHLACGLVKEAEVVLVLRTGKMSPDPYERAQVELRTYQSMKEFCSRVRSALERDPNPNQQWLSELAIIEKDIDQGIAGFRSVGKPP